MIRSSLILLLFLPALLFLPKPAEAQDFATVFPNSATLAGWERGVRVQYLDRFNTRLGAFGDRGYFQRYTRSMNDEYGLNMMMFGFSPTDDFLFFRSPGGFRSSVGAVGNERLIINSELKNAFELAPNHRLDVNLLQQYDYTAERYYLEFQYMWNINGNHHAGLTQNITHHMADMNASLFYQYGNQQDGFIKAAVYMPDYLNNLVFDVYGDKVRFTDTLRVYEILPFPLMYSGSFVSPYIGKFKAEAFIGMQLGTQSRIVSKSDPTHRFRQTQWMHYAGGLIEYTGENASVGITYQREFSRTERDTIGEASISNDYASRQLYEKMGAYVLAGSEEVRWESWVWLVKSVDRQFGEFFDTARLDSIRFKEKQVLLRNRITYNPPHSGFVFSLEHTLDTRNVISGLDDMAFLSYRIHDLNSRLTAIVGYQFHPRAKIVAGGGLDIDGDLHWKTEVDRYDNAFLRMEYRW